MLLRYKLLLVWMYCGESHPVFEVGMFENHFALNFQILSHARAVRSLKHCIGNGDIHVGESDSIEVGPLCGRFASRFVTSDQFDQIGVNILISEHTFFVHATECLSASSPVHRLQ